MKKIILHLCLLFSGIALAQVSSTTPKEPTDPIEEPPRKRAGQNNRGFQIIDNILYIHTYKGEEVKVEVINDGIYIWSQTEASDVFVLPNLQEGMTYTIVITINGNAWSGSFTY